MQDPIKYLVQFFNDASWLANAAGILLPIGGALLFFFRVAKPFFTRRKLDSLFTRGIASKWESGKAKLFARIAIVDDQPQDFPVAALKSGGFTITVYKQIQLSNISELSQYDIVFLDMKGIVKDDPDYGGLKLIAELRKINPYQKICAVSSKTFDPTASEFFRQADTVKKKPLTAQECKAVIDGFLSDLFTFQKLIESCGKTLELLPIAKRAEIIEGLRIYLQKNGDSQDLFASLSNSGLSVPDRSLFVNLYRVILNANK